MASEQEIWKSHIMTEITGQWRLTVSRGGDHNWPVFSVVMTFPIVLNRWGQSWNIWNNARLYSDFMTGLPVYLAMELSLKCVYLKIRFSLRFSLGRCLSMSSFCIKTYFYAGIRTVSWSGIGLTLTLLMAGLVSKRSTIVIRSQTGISL